MDTFHGMAEDTSRQVGESTRAALSTVQRTSMVQRYIRPSYDWVVSKYQQSPTAVRLMLAGFGAMSAIPVGCFLAFMGVVTLGCLIVGGIAFAIVEGGFALFGSAFLLPALGVALLISSGVGIVTLFLYCCYIVAIYVVSFFRGPPIAPATSERAREKAPENAPRSFLG
ncbi:hypothetical protein BGZ65_002084 [Modicella reniformis]|uniref:Uncharacterized protein n=1 Tax=Modicella reniformis TaxID=1440133 RepID=A0A9P6IL77_9FUNG|nr:hypothetical protein BGZ65_002084 [Modicella reniformis]